MPQPINALRLSFPSAHFSVKGWFAQWRSFTAASNRSRRALLVVIDEPPSLKFCQSFKNVFQLCQKTRLELKDSVDQFLQLFSRYGIKFQVGFFGLSDKARVLERFEECLAQNLNAFFGGSGRQRIGACHGSRVVNTG